eukprot:jgi/Botrbrau1/7647/Bobra.0159s0090.1
MGTLSATDNAGFFADVSSVTSFAHISDLIPKHHSLTVPTDYGDGVNYARLCASLPTKQAVGLPMDYNIALGLSSIRGDLLPGQVPPVQSNLALHKLLLQTDVFEKLNEIHKINELEQLFGPTPDYASAFLPTPTATTLAPVTPHRAAPIPTAQADLSPIQGAQPSNHHSLSYRKQLRRPHRGMKGFEVNMSVQRKAVQAPGVGNTSRDKLSPAPVEAAKPSGTGVFLPAPSTGTGVFVPSPHLLPKSQQPKERGLKNSGTAEGSSTCSDSLSCASSFDYLSPVSCGSSLDFLCPEEDGFKFPSPLAPSTPSGKVDRVCLLPDEWEYNTWGLA